MTLPDGELAKVERRHEKAKADIQNNFGAAYSTRIEQDSYSIHQDRAILLRALKERLSAQTGHTEAQQMDSAHHAETGLHDGENGVGFWSLTSAEPTPARLIVGYDIGNINKGGPDPQNAPKLTAEERACVNQPNKIY
jgi:hypothetical protein